MNRAAGETISPEDNLVGPEALTPVGVDEAWWLLLAFRRQADTATGRTRRGEWGFGQTGERWLPREDRRTQLWLDSATGDLRRARRPVTPAARSLFELHGAHAACSGPGHVIAMLGQSLDGFIATRSGHSRYINGRESLVHQHRVRALSDAILIGVGTALADAPRLTTRNVTGPQPVRVVLDPNGRLPASSGLLCDGAAPTLVVRASAGAPCEKLLCEQATALHLPARDGRIAPHAVLRALAERGLRRVLVEGGGVTVSRFLEAGLLNRLQLAVAPLILGGGRPALPVAPVEHLDQALRPSCARHLMGGDVLFDLDFRRATDPS